MLQVTTFWQNVLTEEEKTKLVRNIAGHLKDATDFIQQRVVRNFTQVDPDYGGRIAKLLQQYKTRVSRAVIAYKNNVVEEMVGSGGSNIILCVIDHAVICWALCLLLRGNKTILYIQNGVLSQPPSFEQSYNEVDHCLTSFYH